MKKQESIQPKRIPVSYPVASVVKFIVTLQNCH
jgi:hypothetical protein